MSKDVIRHYLDKHAVVTVQASDGITQKYDNVIVIPVCDESPDFIQQINAGSDKRKILSIVVINSTEDASQNIYHANEHCMKVLHNKMESVVFIPRLAAWLGTLKTKPAIDILLVDRTSLNRRFSKKEGVGYARKIGSDLALALQNRNQIKSSWIHNTDADVILPDNYYEQSDSISDAVALIYPFAHKPSGNTAIDNATLNYEIFLRYYVLGLTWAGFPIPVHTIGSTLAFSGKGYAMVRGFSRRQAAEDFYLINKISKTGIVHSLSGSPIHIQSRESNRAPFGTGPAVSKIVALNQKGGEQYSIYDPQVFVCLKKFIDHVEIQLKQNTIDNVFSDKSWLNEVATALNTTSVIHHIKTRSPHCRRKAFYDWFDMFRIRKFIHVISNNHFSYIPWQQALISAPFIPDDACVNQSLDAISYRLSALEQNTKVAS